MRLLSLDRCKRSDVTTPVQTVASPLHVAFTSSRTSLYRRQNYGYRCEHSPCEIRAHRFIRPLLAGQQPTI